ncbi:WDR62 [Cordylochernes scorpioides]|uniref:WDR62 n=1 Tax=Cordylochernes scorpioides TaxID=51811 RepID=A0ABY6K690_9ARAC|nr:WDR62 [Cordylochernes scorpioides]
MFTHSSFNICAKSSKKIRKSRSDLLKTPDDLTSDGEDSGSGSTPTVSNFSMSTENLAWLDQRGRYLQRNYESLDQGNPRAAESRHSLSAQHLSPASSPAQPQPQPEKPTAPAPSPSLKKIQQTRKREELAKALSEAKKKLETLGWRRGLGASKSVGDLRALPDRDSVWSNSGSSIDHGGS